MDKLILLLDTPCNVQNIMSPKPKRQTAQTKQIVKANVLVEASYRLTLGEQQILLLAIATLGGLKEVDATTRFTVSAQDLVDTFKVIQTNAYRLLQDAAEQLFTRVVLIDRLDPDEPALVKTKTRWIHSIDYLPSKGTLRFYFTPKVLPYLTNLSREFTQYRLVHTAGMTSVYAIRIYELLVQWKSKGELDVELDWLREKFDLPPSYSGIGDLKRRVIKPAVEQINKHSDLWVKLDQRKSGRNVVAFIFTFGPKSEKTADPEKPAPKKRMTTKEMERAARPGESWEELKRRLGIRQ
jgi:plasmid replication initiation protein